MKIIASIKNMDIASRTPCAHWFFSCFCSLWARIYAIFLPFKPSLKSDRVPESPRRQHEAMTCELSTLTREKCCIMDDFAPCRVLPLTYDMTYPGIVLNKAVSCVESLSNSEAWCIIYEYSSSAGRMWTMESGFREITIATRTHW